MSETPSTAVVFCGCIQDKDNKQQWKRGKQQYQEWLNTHDAEGIGTVFFGTASDGRGYIAITETITTSGNGDLTPLYPSNMPEENSEWNSMIEDFASEYGIQLGTLALNIGWYLILE